jgi:hypothetical protein
MTQLEQTTGVVEEGSTEWYACLTSMSTKEMEKVASHMLQGAETVFEDEVLGKLVLSCLRVDDPIRRLNTVAQTQAPIMGSIAKHVGIGKEDPLYQAVAARRFVDVIEAYIEKPHVVSAVTIVKIDPETGALVDTTTSDPQQEKKDLEEKLGIMRERLAVFEERVFVEGERDKPELLSHTFRMNKSVRSTVLHAISANGNWQPLRNRVATIKAAAARRRG